MIRKRIEEVFGWGKEVAGLRRMRLRGLARVGWAFTLRVTAYNLVRLPEAAGSRGMTAPEICLLRLKTAGTPAEISPIRRIVEQ